MANQYQNPYQYQDPQEPTDQNKLQTVGGSAVQGAGMGAVAGPWGALIGGAIGAGYGAYQLGDAKKKRDELMKLNRTRPIYQVPGQIGENTAMYRNMAQNTRIPGQNIAENNIYQGQSNVNNAIVGTGRNAGQIMASLQGANQNTSNSLNQLAVRGAELNQQNRDKYARAMQNQADYSEKAWDMNTFQPYQQRLDEFNRGMAMNRQQQQQGVQTLMNAGTLLGSVYGQSRANSDSRISQTPSNEYANANISQKGLGGGMSTPNDPIYGNNSGFSPIQNNNYLIQSGMGTPLASYDVSNKPFTGINVNSVNGNTYNPYYQPKNLPLNYYFQ